ncbi:MAG: sulfotransferase [Granulosicoccus sp.]
MPTPNLLLIGMPRCGTTALAAAINQHSDILVSNPKEPHFLATYGATQEIQGLGSESFSRQRQYSREKWSALFGTGDEKWRVDASVSTASYPDTSIENIKQHCDPDTHLIIALRDPVERAYSSYMYCLSRGWETETFESSLAKEKERQNNHWQHLWQFTHLSHYEKRLQPFYDNFPLDNIHIVIAEEFMAEPNSVMQKLFGFLDIEHIKIKTVDKVNSSGSPNSEIIQDIWGYIRNRPWLHKNAKKLSSRRFRETLRSANLTKVDMQADTRAMLQDKFRGTRDWVETTLHKDLSRWN